MKIKILGTALLSMFAWDAFAGSHGQQQQKQSGESKFVSLEELKEACRLAEGNPQINPFFSTYSCSEDRTYWEVIGQQTFPLPNHADVSMKASIKDGSYSSDWETLPGHSQCAFGSCDVLEKFKATARYSERIDSCARLEEINNEADFCAVQLSEIWAECGEEQRELGFSKLIQAQEGSGKQQRSSRCHYESLGEVKKCTDSEVSSPKQQCQGSQCDVGQADQGQADQGSCQAPAHQDCSAQLQQCQADDQTCLLQNAQCKSDNAQQDNAQAPVACGPRATMEDLGAAVALVTVKKGVLHRHHKAIEVRDEPLPGSMLDRVGLHKGDVVDSVNDRRVRSVAEFQARMADARDKKHEVKVEFRRGTSWTWTKQTNFK